VERSKKKIGSILPDYLPFRSTPFSLAGKVERSGRKQPQLRPKAMPFSTVSCVSSVAGAGVMSTGALIALILFPVGLIALFYGLIFFISWAWPVAKWVVLGTFGGGALFVCLTALFQLDVTLSPLTTEVFTGVFLALVAAKFFFWGFPERGR
jgi:hypothetical protein